MVTEMLTTLRTSLTRTDTSIGTLFTLPTQEQIEKQELMLNSLIVKKNKFTTMLITTFLKNCMFILDMICHQILSILDKLDMLELHWVKMFSEKITDLMMMMKILTDSRLELIN